MNGARPLFFNLLLNQRLSVSNNAISYRTLLNKPGFVGLLFAVSVGRLASGLVPFGLMAIFAQGEKFMLAGGVSAIFMLVTALSGPWRGRCVDRYSARRALPLLACASGTAIALGFAAFHFAANAWVGVALVCLGGAMVPVNGAVVRSIWSLIAPSEAERKAMHALDSLAEESVHVLSPLVVAAIWLLVGPDWAVLLGCLAIGGGTGLLFWFGHAAGPEVAAVLLRKNPPKTKNLLAKSGIVFTPAWIALTLPMFGFAMCMGFASINFAAWASTNYVTSLTGVLAAMTSVGGIVGGLIYGKVRISTQAATKLYLIMPAFVGLFTLPMFFSNALFVAGSVALLVGLVMTPMFIAAYVGIPNSFSKENFNEANASIGSAYNLGSGMGALLAGVLVQQVSMHISFIGAVALPVFATMTAAIFARQAWAK